MASIQVSPKTWYTTPSTASHLTTPSQGRESDMFGDKKVEKEGFYPALKDQEDKDDIEEQTVRIRME